MNAEPHTHELEVECWGSSSVRLAYGTSVKHLYETRRSPFFAHRAPTVRRIRRAARKLKQEHDRGSTWADRQGSKIARGVDLARQDLAKQGWPE